MIKKIIPFVMILIIYKIHGYGADSIESLIINDDFEVTVLYDFNKVFKVGNIMPLIYKIETTKPYSNNVMLFGGEGLPDTQIGVSSRNSIKYGIFNNINDSIYFVQKGSIDGKIQNAYFSPDGMNILYLPVENDAEFFEEGLGNMCLYDIRTKKEQIININLKGFDRIIGFMSINEILFLKGHDVLSYDLINGKSKLIISLYADILEVVSCKQSTILILNKDYKKNVYHIKMLKYNAEPIELIDGDAKISKLFTFDKGDYIIYQKEKISEKYRYNDIFMYDVKKKKEVCIFDYLSIIKDEDITPTTSIITGEPASYCFDDILTLLYITIPGNIHEISGIYRYDFKKEIIRRISKLQTTGSKTTVNLIEIGKQ